MIIRATAVIIALGVVAGPAAAESPSPAMFALPKKLHARYSCQNLKVPVTYDNVKRRVLITYGSHRYNLPQVESADGARYMNIKVEWWSKGTSAKLSSVENGNAANVLATCTQIAPK